MATRERKCETVAISGNGVGQAQYTTSINSFLCDFTAHFPAIKIATSLFHLPLLVVCGSIKKHRYKPI